MNTHEYNSNDDGWAVDKCEVAASKMRSGGAMRREKRNPMISNPAYIYQCRTRQPYAVYIHQWVHVTNEYMLRICIGDVASPTNI
jgi:hypothetical protein